MSTRTYYTTTINTPAYAAWVCQECKEANFSLGSISCEGRASSSSIFKSRQEKARSDASWRANAAWKENALIIITEPLENPEKLKNNLYLNNSAVQNADQYRSGKEN